METTWWWVVAGCVVLAAIVRKLRKIKRDKEALEAQIEELLVISDSLNRTQGRRARRIAWRTQTIRDLVRELPPLDAEQST